MSGRVVIFTDEPGWHGRRLRTWFDSRGLEAVFASLNDCRVELESEGHGIVIPACGNELPLGAFVRGIAGGSLEAITLRLDFLHVLQQLGCPVFNDARTIERTVDKAMTSLLLRRHRIPTPRTFCSQDVDAARAYVKEALAKSRPLVSKPLFGSQGKGLSRIEQYSDFPEEVPGGVYYFQEFIDSARRPFRDCRVMVIENEAIAAMERSSHHWITNRAQGADCRSIALHDDLAAIAVAAARAVGAAYAGVDLLRDANGEWLVTEVNGIPAWQGLQRATGVDVTELLGDAFIRQMDGLAAAHG